MGAHLLAKMDYTARGLWVMSISLASFLFRTPKNFLCVCDPERFPVLENEKYVVLAGAQPLPNCSAILFLKGKNLHTREQRGI